MPKQHICRFCRQKFTSYANYVQHKTQCQPFLNARQHQQQQLRHENTTCETCSNCGESFRNNILFLQHKKKCKNIGEKQCVHCMKSFKKQEIYMLHQKYRKAHGQCPSNRVACSECGTTFSRYRNLVRHVEFVHIKNLRKKANTLAKRYFITNCHICGKELANFATLQKHIEKVHTFLTNNTQDENGFQRYKTAFENRATSFMRYFGIGPDGAIPFKELYSRKLRLAIQDVIEKQLAITPALKFSIIVNGDFVLYGPDGKTESRRFILPMRSRAFPVLQQDMRRRLSSLIRTALRDSEHRSNDINVEGSGYTLLGVISISIECLPMRSLTGGTTVSSFLNYKVCKSYKSIIGIDYPNSTYLLDLTYECNLPDYRKNQCVLYAICSALVLQENKQQTLTLSDLRIKTEEFMHTKIDVTGMSFPSSVIDVELFVKRNKKLNVRVNILTYIDGQIYPLKLNIAKNKQSGTGPYTEKDEIVVNLLLARVKVEPETPPTTPVTSSNEKNTNITTYNMSDTDKNIVMNPHLGDPGHFFLITDINLFLRKHYTILQSDAVDTKVKTKTYSKKNMWCLTCFTPFRSTRKYKQHLTVCTNKTCQFEMMPKKPTEKQKELNKTKKFQRGNILQFDKFYAKFPLSYTLYYDFEVLLVPNNTMNSDNITITHCFVCEEKLSTLGRCRCGDAEVSSSSNIHHKHVPVMYSYVLVNDLGKLILEETRVCPEGDAAEHFMNSLLSKEDYFRSLVSHVADMEELTEEQEEKFNSSDTCIVCEEKFDNKEEENNPKVMDHCHLTSKFLGSSHNVCNMLREQRKFLNCIAHNAVSVYYNHI